MISFNEFKNIDLRVAKVLTVEDIEGKDKLYKLKVDAGEKRILVAGIKEFYSKEELVGKNIVIVFNLQPAKIAGVESNGMLLAAQAPDGSYKIVTVDESVKPGTKVE